MQEPYLQKNPQFVGIWPSSGAGCSIAKEIRLIHMEKFQKVIITQIVGVWIKVRGCQKIKNLFPKKSPQIVGFQFFWPK